MYHAGYMTVNPGWFMVDYFSASSVLSVANLRNASHREFSGICLISEVKFSIIINKIYLAYRIRKTGDRKPFH